MNWASPNDFLRSRKKVGWLEGFQLEPGRGETVVRLRHSCIDALLRFRSSRRPSRRSKMISMAEAPPNADADSLVTGLRRLISENQLESMASQLVDSAKFSVRLNPMAPVGEHASLFNSLGGQPELPEGLEWPKNSAGRPLMFLAQIQLSTLSELIIPPECPNSGRLYFFCDGWENIFRLGYNPGASDGWRVLYTQDEAVPLISTEPPEELYKNEVFPFVPVIPCQDITIPAIRSIELTRLPELTDESRNRYWDLSPNPPGWWNPISNRRSSIISSSSSWNSAKGSPSCHGRSASRSMAITSTSTWFSTIRS